MQGKWAIIYLSRFLFVTSDGQGALYYEGPALVLLQTEQGHVLGALSTQTLHVLVVMETGQPTEQHWSDWMIWIMDVHKFRLHIILYTFHNHALSVVGDSQYRSHPWFQSRSQPQLPGFGATIMGSLLVQPSAGCQMLRKKRQVWGIAGEKPQVTADVTKGVQWRLRFALQPAFTVQVPQVPKVGSISFQADG